jgi:sortase A
VGRSADEQNHAKATMQSRDTSLYIGRLLVEHELASVEPNEFFTIRGQIRALLVGLAWGTAVIVVFLFTLFNQLVIAPFIQPGKSSVLPPAVDATGTPADTTPKIRIPKINVEIPIVYDVASTDEKDFQVALDKGVAHYPSTVMPGQSGNAAFFGHSSNNIFNPGSYKFAFVLLHELEVKDNFYLTYNDKLYSYEVVSKQIVKPTDIGVLGPVEGQVATATLITCDPPGTSNNRLVIVGKQTDPDPTATQVPTSATTTKDSTLVTSNLPGNGPNPIVRLWQAIFD